MAKASKMPRLPMGGGKNDPHATAGPTMPTYGADLPPNPADRLREGPLPVRQAEYGNYGVISRSFDDSQRAASGVTSASSNPDKVAIRMSRPFNLPTKPTLHYRDGIDGAAETVTVNERRFDQREDPPTQSRDWDHGEYGYEPGEDPNKYSRNPNKEFTERGARIYGS